MFNPKETLTRHDVEVQIHTIKSIIETLTQKGKTTINIQTLQRLLEMGMIQVSAMKEE